MCASCLKKSCSLILTWDANDACLLLCCLCLGLWVRGMARGWHFSSDFCELHGRKGLQGFPVTLALISLSLVQFCSLFGGQGCKKEKAKLKEMDPICKNLLRKGKFTFIPLQLECFIKQIGVHLLWFRLCVLKSSPWRLRSLWPAPS